MRRAGSALLLALLLACGAEEPAGSGAAADGGTDPDPGTDPDSDPDTDPGTDGDTDPDTDGDTDADPDADGDGVTVGAGDCDDADPAVWPGAPEVWSDGVDQDCDGQDTTHADACADAAPCPDADGHYNNADAWATVEQCSAIPGMLSWTPQSGGGPVPNTCVEEVGMDVVVDGATDVRSLGPLSRLRAVGGDVKIVSVPHITDLRGLESLRETGEHILLMRNDALVDVSALADVQRVRRKLGIEENAQLADVSPLLGIGSVDETLAIRGNPALCADQVDALVEHVQAANPDVELQLGDNGGC